MKPITENNLVLIGFMGCGKSSAAYTLGKRYHMDVAEMDQIIEEQQGMSIPEIFERYGEEYFRSLETSLLDQLKDRHGCVISCGGGVVLRQENVKKLKALGTVVLLTASPETVCERTRNSSGRPNLRNRKSPAAVAELMEQRRPCYEAAADYILSTDGISIKDLCEELIRLVQKGGPEKERGGISR